MLCEQWITLKKYRKEPNKLLLLLLKMCILCNKVG